MVIFTYFVAEPWLNNYNYDMARLQNNHRKKKRHQMANNISNFKIVLLHFSIGNNECAKKLLKTKIYH